MRGKFSTTLALVPQYQSRLVAMQTALDAATADAAEAQGAAQVARRREALAAERCSRLEMEMVEKVSGARPTERGSAALLWRASNCRFPFSRLFAVGARVDSPRDDELCRSGGRAGCVGERRERVAGEGGR